MKKMALISLTAALTFSLAACGGNDDKKDDVKKETTHSSTADPTPDVTETPDVDETDPPVTPEDPTTPTAPNTDDPSSPTTPDKPNPTTPSGKTPNLTKSEASAAFKGFLMEAVAHYKGNDKPALLRDIDKASACIGEILVKVNLSEEGKKIIREKRFTENLPEADEKKLDKYEDAAEACLKPLEKYNV